MATPLSRELRNRLAKVCLDARERAETAARAALEHLAVHEREYRSHMSLEQRELRNRLRARARSLGDERRVDTGTQAIEHLVEQTAYEHWHRLLFTRFLAENHLLRSDEATGGVAITMEECAELAEELGAKDGEELACRFATEQLPGIFQSNDPVLELTLATNDMVELRRLVESLPREVYLASDSLGWLYQFWQAKRKDEVNKSGKKIGAKELPAVTQLFTEDYMVDFLLDNTLGAWHAGKVLAAHPEQAKSASCEDELRQFVSLPNCPWSYLRFIKDDTGTWKPAAGTFEGWPTEAKDVACLDPCMGSGHFVVALFERMLALRLHEESLNEANAVTAVIRDNIFGLEIDPRCTQIAAFNLALAAWRRVGYCELPEMNLACSGLAPNAREADWLALAGNDQRLRAGMKRLYDLSKEAPLVGSLLDPQKNETGIFNVDFDELKPLLEEALSIEAKIDAFRELTNAALGISKALMLLSNRYSLISTNVPFLGKLKQARVLVEYCDIEYPLSKADIATCFFERCLNFCNGGATIAMVFPQNPLFLGSYKAWRKAMLKSSAWNAVARLGEHVFESSAAAGGFTTLLAVTKSSKSNDNRCDCTIDASSQRGERPIYASEKKSILLQRDLTCFAQKDIANSTDSTISFHTRSKLPLLSNYAESLQGCGLADIVIYRKLFWEFDRLDYGWEAHQSSPSGTGLYTGFHFAVKWEDGKGSLARLPEATIRGRKAWGKDGIVCAWFGRLPVGVYLGTLYDNSAAAIIPKNTSHQCAIWCYMSSSEYAKEVRKINQKTQVANATLVKVPFDLPHWQKVAAEKYPNGLPKPYSSDPTQWLFNGHPKDSDQPLHVAVARLLGYQWPRQTGSEFPDCPALGPDGLEKLADQDGIVCLPPLQREQPAAGRLRTMLAKALGDVDESKLIASTGLKGSKSRKLEDWLQNEFFEQHCKLFHDRPFIWHIWDGRKDGFQALVNYHKLDNATLQKLIYSYLGTWIRVQEEEAKADVAGAAERLGAARILQQELVRILEGEAPCDIFVRWKPLAQQAIGWQPDLNDGVRLNIRPFLMANDVGKKGAGVLKAKPNIKWTKDRGKEPQRDKEDFPWFWCEDEPGTDPKPGRSFVGSRWSDVHLTLGAKQGARG